MSFGKEKGMRRKNLAAGIMVMALSMLLFSACRASDKPIPLPELADASGLSAQFSNYYQPVKYELNPSVPPYELPLKPEDIYNFSKASSYLAQPAARELFLKHGMVTLNWGQNDDIVQAYKNIKQMEVPVFVTSDSLLHLYHIQFDETLRRIEEKEFYPDLVKISQVMQTEFLKRYEQSPDSTKDAYLEGAAYFTVGLKLLKPEMEIPKLVKPWVEWELEHIEKHAGFPSAADAAENSIFTYMEDYSQYVPRGHYTQSEELKRYFKAMMWYGRMTMLIKGADKFGPMEEALVSKEEAKSQTILAATIAGLAGNLKIGDASLMDKWYRIYAVSAYYVGFSDDLTIYEYRDVLRALFGESFKPSQLAADKTLLEFQARLASLRKPAIYSGTGQAGVNLDQEKDRQMTPEQLVRTLAKTQGFRFMGQRYVPDSFILGQMVSPTIDQLLGRNCFTALFVPDVGFIRAFPRGLDVLAVLGSPRARAVLDEQGDSNYGRYEETFAKLKQQFAEVPEKDWNQNLYWSWLYALKSLTSEPG